MEKKGKKAPVIFSTFFHLGHKGKKRLFPPSEPSEKPRPIKLFEVLHSFTITYYDYY